MCQDLSATMSLTDPSSGSGIDSLETKRTTLLTRPSHCHVIHNASRKSHKCLIIHRKDCNNTVVARLISALVSTLS